MLLRYCQSAPLSYASCGFERYGGLSRSGGAPLTSVYSQPRRLADLASVQFGQGSTSLLSLQYSRVASVSCLLLFVHWIHWAFALALANAGSSSAARMAMMAMTTSSSMSVNAGLPVNLVAGPKLLTRFDFRSVPF